MAIVPEANAKKGNIPYSSKRKIRPIVREQFSDERAASEIFAMNQDAKLMKGPDRKSPSIGGKSAGSKIAPAVGGGTYSPNSASNHNPGNIGTT